MYFDWIASFFELIGTWIVGNKNKNGYLFTLAGLICWILYVFITKQTYGLLLVVIPALFITIRNYLKWNKEEKK